MRVIQFFMQCRNLFSVTFCSFVNFGMFGHFFPALRGSNDVAIYGSEEARSMALALIHATLTIYGYSYTDITPVALPLDWGSML